MDQFNRISVDASEQDEFSRKMDSEGQTNTEMKTFRKFSVRSFSTECHPRVPRGSTLGSGLTSEKTSPRREARHGGDRPIQESPRT